MTLLAALTTSSVLAASTVMPTALPTALPPALSPALPIALQTVVAASVDRTLQDARITESSGLARSGYARRVLFTHNDSGDGPVVYAVGRSGATRAVLHLHRASAVDWEDISSGPRRTLWLGDIGDNRAQRRTISVYRIKEPRDLRTGRVRWARYALVYPDGPRDAEGLMVHPRTGRVFVVSKESGGGSIYRAPRVLSTTRVNRLRRIASAPAVVTAASFSSNGRRLVMSDYVTAFIKRSPSGRVTRRINLPSTSQGESIELSRNGRAVLRGSEGERSPVWRIPLG